MKNVEGFIQGFTHEGTNFKGEENVNPMRGGGNPMLMIGEANYQGGGAKDPLYPEIISVLYSHFFYSIKFITYKMNCMCIV